MYDHVKRSITIKEWHNIQEKGDVWLCKNCTLNDRKTNTVKCSTCRSTIPKHKIENQCTICNKFYHSKCSQIKKNQPLDSWMCNICIDDTLPLSMLDNEKLKLTMQAKHTNFGDHVILSPSFTIQSLLDKIPGSVNYNSDDFLTDLISSRYYTPIKFLTSKFKNKYFSMIHMNIAYLSLHIDDLKMLLDLLLLNTVMNIKSEKT